MKRSGFGAAVYAGPTVDLVRPCEADWMVGGVIGWLAGRLSYFFEGAWMRGWWSSSVCIGMLVILGVGLSSCKQKGKADNRYVDPKALGQLVDSKYSLQAERDQLDELRKEIPAEVRAANDEAAFIPQLFAEGKKPPTEIRRSFDQLVRTKRDAFDRDMKREREAFQVSNRRKRDDFLGAQGRDRIGFQKSKNSREDTGEFFRDQDEKRKVFFADERERSDDFDSQMREKRRNFDDYMRSKTNEFNEELRTYSKKYDDDRKAEREAGRKKPRG